MDSKMRWGYIASAAGLLLLLFNAYSYLAHQGTSPALTVVGLTACVVGAKQVRGSPKKR